MSLNLQGFSALVTRFTTAVQSSYAGLANFTTGSVNLAFGEASSSAGLWLQALLFKLLLFARASTSFGSDLDSWVNQYGVFRLGSASATGSVTFNRFSALAPATTIPVGAIVMTADASQQFAVVADATIETFDATNNCYDVAANVTSISLPVMATTSGAGGNVAAGLVNTMLTALSAVDFVTNPAAMGGGLAAETDTALRARFVMFINSLSKGTLGAVAYAIVSMQLGLNYQIVERQLYAQPNVVKDAYFYVVVDDGTGNPPSSLVTRAFTAVDAVRAGGIQISVFAPVIVNSTIAMTLNIAAGYVSTVVVGQVYQALFEYANTLPLGAPLDFLKLAQIAYDASPGVASVASMSINSATSSIAINRWQVSKSPTIAVSPT